jgi:hypothetical protein
MQNSSKTRNSLLSNPYKISGFLMITIGVLLGLDQILKTGWLSFAIFPLCGLIMICLGLYLRAFGWLVAGSLVFGLGCGGYFLLSERFQMLMTMRVGFSLIAFGSAWLLIVAFSVLIHFRTVAWWAIVPAGVLIGAGVALAFSPLRVVDFFFYILCGLGFSLLVWGVGARLFGLIIPGCLLLGIGPGIYFGWRDLSDINALAQSGVMLVWFAFGWGLITVLARRTYGRFLWWPLIPAGILAVAGWGVFIGGDPGNALGFIGNTGTIGILVFGLYLVLMRKGIHH